MYVWVSAAAASHHHGGDPKIRCSWHCHCDSPPHLRAQFVLQNGGAPPLLLSPLGTLVTSKPCQNQAFCSLLHSDCPKSPSLLLNWLPKSSHRLQAGILLLDPGTWCIPILITLIRLDLAWFKCPCKLFKSRVHVICFCIPITEHSVWLWLSVNILEWMYEYVK